MVYVGREGSTFKGDAGCAEERAVCGDGGYGWAGHFGLMRRCVGWMLMQCGTRMARVYIRIIRCSSARVIDRLQSG